MKLNIKRWLGLSMALAITLALSGCTFSSSLTVPGKAEDMKAVVDQLNKHNKQVMTGTISLKVQSKDKEDRQLYEELATVLSPIYATTKTMDSEVSLLESKLEFEYKLRDGDMSIYVDCDGRGFKIITDDKETAFMDSGTFLSLMKAQMPESIDKVKTVLGDKSWVKAPMNLTSEFSFKIPDGDIEEVLTGVTVESKEDSTNGKVQTYTAVIPNDVYAGQVESIPKDLVNKISITYSEQEDTYKVINTLEVPGKMTLVIRYEYEFMGVKIEKPSEEDVIDTTVGLDSTNNSSIETNETDSMNREPEDKSSTAAQSGIKAADVKTTENGTTYIVDFGTSVSTKFLGSMVFSYDEEKSLEKNFNLLHSVAETYAVEQGYKSNDKNIDKTYANDIFSKYSEGSQLYETIGVYAGAYGSMAMEYEASIDQSIIELELPKVLSKIETISGIEVEADLIAGALNDIKAACTSGKEYYIISFTNEADAEISLYASNSILTGDASISLRASRNSGY